MIKKRDGQGLSLSTIVIAALALIVLVVLIAIFTDNSGDNVTFLKSCAGKGGECSDDCGDGGKRILFGKCEDPSKPQCCMKFS